MGTETRGLRGYLAGENDGPGGEGRDGFEVVGLDSGEVVHFVPCAFEGRQRERALSGLLINMRADCFARDTRDGDPER